MDHRRARSGWTDDRVGFAGFENFNESFRNLPRFVAITGIERRLAAARLAVVKLNFTTSAPQHGNGTRADAAPKLIDQARDEEGNLHLYSQHYYALHIFGRMNLTRQRGLNVRQRLVAMSN